MPPRISIATKFFLTYFVITGAALAFAGMAGYFQFRQYALDETDRHLAIQARLAAGIFRPLLESSEPDRHRIALEGDRVGKDLGIRLTVVLPAGEVVADSVVGSGKLAEMENHAERLEIREALAGRTGVSMRRSITLGDEERYLAVPVFSGPKIVGISRASIPVSVMNERLGRVRAITWGTGLAAFLLMLIGTAARAKRVAEPLSEMRAAARELASGNLRRRVQVSTGDELEEMADALNRIASHQEEAISQLSGEKKRLATLLENLSEGVLVIGADRTVRLMNRQAIEILDRPGTPGEGRPYPEVIRQPGVLAFIDDRMRGEPSLSREISLPSRAGERAVRLSATEVRYEADRGVDLLLTLRDVTEERRLSRIKSDFVSNASHELRTPLTNVRGYLEAMQDALKDGQPVDPAFLSVALENALRMERLIDDLLELSRAESGQSPLSIDEIALTDFLERVAALHRPEAERRGKTLTAGSEDVRLTADLGKLAVAVSNLVDNAVKYGREGGLVRLCGRSEGDACVLEVSDDGPGIPPEHLPRIFERFYRVDKGRSRDLGGTGLGLAIARHIVESHGGTIRVESRLGVGTRVEIRIPVRS